MYCRGYADGMTRSTLAAMVALLALLAASLPVAAQAPTPPPQPTISSVKPLLAKPGQKLVIKGTGYINVRAVTLAGVSLPFTVKSRRRIEARAPRNAARGPVMVSTRGGVIASPRLVVVKPRLKESPTSATIGERARVR